MIKGTDLTLAKLQEIARSFEAVDIQLKAMCGKEQQVNRVYHKETDDQYVEGKAAVTSVTEKVISVVIDVAQRETRNVRSAIK